MTKRHKRNWHSHVLRVGVISAMILFVHTVVMAVPHFRSTQLQSNEVQRIVSVPSTPPSTSEPLSPQSHAVHPQSYPTSPNLSHAVPPDLRLEAKSAPALIPKAETTGSIRIVLHKSVLAPPSTLSPEWTGIPENTSGTHWRHYKLHSGSLRANIERLAHDMGWSTVVWAASHDYRWLGNIKIAAAGGPALMARLLNHYPLQAVFYTGNHILVIQPRTLKS